MMATSPKHEFDLEGLAAALLRVSGETSGSWRLAFAFRFAARGVELTLPETNSKVVLPAGISAISGAALFEAHESGPLVFDAAEVLAKFPLPRRTPSSSKTNKAKAAAKKAVTKKAAARKP